jgi:hypothetical protein
MVQANDSGPKVFVGENGKPLNIWLDPRLTGALGALIRTHGGLTTDHHDDPAIRLLILHPASVEVYDRYCHPSWLPMSGRDRYRRFVQAGGKDESEHKLLLADSWVKLCVQAGKVLGEEDNWGWCRKGG